MITSADVWEKYDTVNKSWFEINPMIILAGILVIFVLVIIFMSLKRRHKKMNPEDRIETADVIDEMPLDDFLDITDEQYKQANDVGVYILYNLDKEKYYIGKDYLCADAVNRQIIGKGTADIFYEKKDGDDFTVQFYFLCEGSAYKDLDSLYDDIIAIYGENFEVVCL